MSHLLAESWLGPFLIARTADKFWKVALWARPPAHSVPSCLCRSSVGTGSCSLFLQRKKKCRSSGRKGAWILLLTSAFLLPMETYKSILFRQEYASAEGLWYADCMTGTLQANAKEEPQESHRLFACWISLDFCLHSTLTVLERRFALRALYHWYGNCVLFELLCVTNWNWIRESAPWN